MMTVFWGVTPLISSVFNTARITYATDVTATTALSVLPLQDQLSQLNRGFVMAAYDSIWLDQDLPGWVTNDSVLVPFLSNSAGRSPALNETLSSTTAMYSSSLLCNSAVVENSSSGVRYSNGKGCKTDPLELSLDGGTDFQALYIGWYPSPYTDYYLSGMGCSSAEFSHTFLAFLGETKNGTLESSSLFCEPSYWIQKVNATVSSPDSIVLGIQPLESPQPLTDATFNISNFEYVASTGDISESKREDVPYTTTTMDQTNRLEKLGIAAESQVSDMMAFAFGATQLELSEYLNDTVLASSLEHVQKLLFSLALNSLLSANVSAPDPRHGVLQGTMNAVVVVRTLALLVEFFLGFAILLSLALLYTSWRRSSQFRKDPASLYDVMSMIGPEMPTAVVANDPSASSSALRTRIKNGMFCFQGSKSHNECSSMEQERSITSGTSAGIPTSDQNHDSSPGRPWEMRLVVATIFIAILMLALVTLVITQIDIQKRVGLPLPSHSLVVNQLLTNYVPVVFATFLEPFWLLLNRLLCILQPFEELRKGEARPSKSINLKYTSLPPQLVIWRAWRAHHFLLVAVCAIGLSANVLSVALSGLFQTYVGLAISKTNFDSQYLPLFVNGTVITTTSPDPFYVLQSNVSHGTPLPAWTSPTRYFLPFDIRNISGVNESTTTYEAASQGFGVDLNCTLVESPGRSFLVIRNVTAPQKIDNGRNGSCFFHTDGPAGGQNKTMAALEFFGALFADPQSPTEGMDACDNLLVASFHRANLTVSADSFKVDDPTDLLDKSPDIFAVNSYSSVWLVCRPSLLTAPYTIIVTPNGRIQSATQLAPYSTDLTSFFSPTFALNDLLNHTRLIWDDSYDVEPFWHNDTFADSWFSYFAKVFSDTTLVDPQQPVPTFDAITPVLQEIYSRVFAIALGLNPSVFATAPNGTTVPGKILTSSTRIFISRPAFLISLILIALNIVVAMAYYIKRPKSMQLRLPMTIARVLGLFDGSGLVAEVRGNESAREEWKIGYGRFVGTDGKPRIGIERRPFVVGWDQT